MLAISPLFEEGTFKKGMKAAGKSILSGTGLALKGTGQAVTTTGDALNKKFSDKDNQEELARSEKRDRIRGGYGSSQSE